MNGEILTFTGKLVKPLDINPKDIDPIDIAHALSNQCRYTGHTKWFYSVAQHSVIMYDYLRSVSNDAGLWKWGLLHDATEAYLLDLAAPVKHDESGFGQAFCEAEHKIEEAVAMRFGLQLPMPREVKEVDMRIRENEFNELMNVGEREQSHEPLPIKIYCWSPNRSRIEFLSRLRGLGMIVPTEKGFVSVDEVMV